MSLQDLPRPPLCSYLTSLFWLWGGHSLVTLLGFLRRTPMYFPCFVAGTTSLPPHGCPPDIRSTHALHLRPRAVLRAQFLPNTTRSFGRMSDPCEKYPAPCPTAFLSPYSLIPYAPALCAFCFPALFKYRDVPAIFRQNPFRKDARGYCAKPGRTFPGCWRASCKQKAPKPRHPSRIVFGSGASIFMTVYCHTICIGVSNMSLASMSSPVLMLISTCSPLFGGHVS